MYTFSAHFRVTILQVVMTIAITVFAQNILAIQVLTENSPPYQYVENGELKGSSIQAVREILDCAKLQEPIDLMPWKRAYQTALNQKNTLIFSIARTPEREKQFIWISPIFKSTAYFYKLKSRKDIQIQSMQDLNGLSIGSLADDYKTKYLLSLPNSEQFKIYYINNRRSQMLMLSKGRFDLTANDPKTFMSMVEEFKLDPKDFEQLAPLGTSLTLFLAINKDSDKNLVQSLKLCSKTYKD